MDARTSANSLEHKMWQRADFRYVAATNNTSGNHDCVTGGMSVADGVLESSDEEEEHERDEKNVIFAVGNTDWCIDK